MNQLSVFFAAVLLACNASSAAESFWGCIDLLGKPVRTITNSASNYVAQAVLTGSGVPVIVMNPRLLKLFSKTTRTFIYWHECGHIMHGHLQREIPLTAIEEQGADCTGIRIPMTLGLFRHDRIPELQAELSALSGDWQHLPGGMRAIMVEKCLGDGIQPEKWQSCRKMYNDNLDFIEKATPEIEKAVKICRRFGAGSSECGQAKALAAQLNEGIMKSIGITDNSCPFAEDPKFFKIVARFQAALTRLRFSQ